MSLRRLLHYLVLAALFGLPAHGWGQEPPLAQARRLIDAKQAKAAYELLAPLEAQNAGNPDFDYLFGIAAIDAGERTRGIFALERVLAVRPDHPQARAEIARAYFLIGELKVARQEFEAVKSASPPREVAESIDGFLDAITQRERTAGSGVSAYLEMAVGFDDNVNGATGTRSFGIPAFPGLNFNLTGTSARQRDGFTGLSGGVFARQAIDPTLALVGNATFDRRLNHSQDRFDTGSLNLSGGVSYKPQKDDEFFAGLQIQTYSVDNNRFRDALGLVGQWRRALDERNQVTGYVQWTRLAYPTSRTRNADRTVVGATWAHTFGGARAPVATLGVYAGTEDELGRNVAHFGHRLMGVRLGGQILVTPQWTLSASLSYEDRKYGGREPLFLVARDDQETQFRLAASYALSRDWTITPQFTYSDTRSNIVVNRSDRSSISVAARMLFQ